VLVSVGYEDGRILEVLSNVEQLPEKAEGKKPWQDQLITQQQKQ